MPLDPQIAPIVELINAAAAERDPIAEQTVQDQRDGYRGLGSIVGEPPVVESVIDNEIAEIPVRIYANEGAVGLFIFFHGGGWVIGDLDSHDPLCRQLAIESGATVIAVDYPLAPEHPFPAATEACWKVMQAVDADRESYGAGTKIVVAGDSAGGNLAAVMALMARDEGMEIAHQLLIYPGVDASDDSPSMTDNAVGYVLTAELMQWFHSHYQPDPADWRASPLHATSHADVAPALVITAEFDPLRDQGAKYAAALSDAGVPTVYENYEGQVHAFFQLGPLVDAGARAVTQVATVAKAALSS